MKSNSAAMKNNPPLSAQIDPIRMCGHPMSVFDKKTIRIPASFISLSTDQVTRLSEFLIRTEGEYGLGAQRPVNDDLGLPDFEYSFAYGPNPDENPRYAGHYDILHAYVNFKTAVSIPGIDQEYPRNYYPFYFPDVKRPDSKPFPVVEESPMESKCAPSQAQPVTDEQLAIDRKKVAVALRAYAEGVFDTNDLFHIAGNVNLPDSEMAEYWAKADEVDASREL